MKYRARPAVQSSIRKPSFGFRIEELPVFGVALLGAWMEGVATAYDVDGSFPYLSRAKKATAMAPGPTWVPMVAPMVLVGSSST